MNISLSGLSLNFKKSLVELLVQVHSDLKNDYLKSNNFRSANGVHFYKWDKLNTSCLNGEVEDVIAFLNKRSSWEFVTLFEPISGTMITLMNENNLERRAIQFGKTKQPHYIHAYSNFNPSINEMPSGHPMSYQRELLPLSEDEEWNRKTIKLQMELVGDRFNEVKQHVVVSFKNHHGAVAKVTCIKYSQEMVALAEEDWSEFINLPYLDESAENAESPVTPDQPKNVVALSKKNNVIKLREKYKPNNSDED
ncbi:DUF5986 family protein [Planococcus sp. 1R117A]|uniref:DUF5986 family protein n=1 Tax=Planococcus sp. 1R117A TaxID=3447020 RepID=UPI003EDC0A27